MTLIVELLIDPLTYPFMQRGLLAAVLVGIVCAVIGTYIVLRGMAFFGDALAHAILPGMALGYLVSGGSRSTLFWWALITAIFTSLGIGAVRKGTRVKSDTAIGIIFAGMFALGIALVSTMRSYTIDLTHFLFGDILSVSSSDLLVMSSFSLVIIGMVLVFYKEFLVLAFDPTLAATLRIPTRFFEHLFQILVAVAIVVSLQTVGVALMVAMLVTPAATAYLLTKRLPIMMMVAAGLASVSGVVGLYLSYYINVASGAMIVLTSTFGFVITWAFQGFFRSKYQKKAIH